MRRFGVAVGGVVLAVGAVGACSSSPDSSPVSRVEEALEDGGSDTYYGSSDGGDGGFLDPTFGSGGQVQTTLSAGNSQIGAAAVQPDGRIVVAGSIVTSTGQSRVIVGRYWSSGALDTTFGTGGTSIVDFGASTDNSGATSLDLQADGKIVVAGVAHDPTTAAFVLAVGRFNGNGSLDGSFGTGGVVRVTFPSSVMSVGASVRVDRTSGKIYAIGSLLGDADGRGKIAVARLTSSGALDTTFGSGGTTATDPDSTREASAVSSVLQSDGKLLVSGLTAQLRAITSEDRNGRFLTLRYKTDGTLDSTFGSGGLVITDFAPGGITASGQSIALQTDGRILVGGPVVATGKRPSFGLARYTTAGALDSSFGIGGKEIVHFGTSTNDVAFAIAVRTDGRIIAVGSSGTSGSKIASLAIGRYWSNGTPDSTFGINGVVLSPFSGTTFGLGSAVAVQTNGAVIAAGRSISGPSYHFALARAVP